MTGVSARWCTGSGSGSRAIEAETRAPGKEGGHKLQE
jgi:hypothetical protein